MLRWIRNAGQVSEFEDVALVHLDLLYRAALRLAHNRTEAEDLVQETWLRALRHFDQFDPGSNCRAWLLTILRNAFLNRLRREGREIIESDMVADGTGAARLEEASVTHSGPEEDFFQAMLHADVDRALLIASLVDKHLAYAQLEGPAEFSSTERPAVAAWFRQRTGLRVPVPDLSPAGIQLVGARIAEADQHKVAYLLYEKGHVLMSVFMVPEAGRHAPLAGRPMRFRGQEYLAQERQGLRTISWRDGQTLFSLVSTLDYNALLECAEQLRAERAREARL